MADPIVVEQTEETVLDVVSRCLRDGDFSSALIAAEHAYAGNPTAEVVCAMAAIAYRQGNIASAIKLLEPVCEGMGGQSDIPEILAILNCLAGRVSEALYYGKLATVLLPDQQILPLFGEDFPEYAVAFLGVEHKPLLVKGRAAFDDGDVELATLLVEQHLQLFLDDVDALDFYSQCLMHQKLYRQSIAVLRSILTLVGPSATLLSRLGQSLVALGYFDEGVSCHRQAVSRAPKAASLWAALVSDLAYSPWTLGAGDEGLSGFFQAIAQSGPKVARKAPEAKSKEVLSVGILCNAPQDAITRQKISRFAGGFKRGRVRVVGFGPGDMDAALNLVYRGNFDVWRNTQKVDELTLAAMIRGEGVDVLIDADGLFARERNSLFLRNSAPLQYSWLNVTGNVSMPGSHGKMTDGAAGVSGALFVAGSSASSPLPALTGDGVTYGADVTAAELNPEVVRLWASLLNSVPKASLVLMDRGFSSDSDLAGRLIDLFGNFGVAHRVDVISAETAEEFFTNVDVALAPFPVARPDSYGAALLCGVPVVALAQCDGAGLVSALLSQGGALKGMVAGTLDEYLAIAEGYGSDLSRLAELRKEIPEQVRNTSLFLGSLFAESWEGVFREKLRSLVSSEVCA